MCWFRDVDRTPATCYDSVTTAPKTVATPHQYRNGYHVQEGIDKPSQRLSAKCLNCNKPIENPKGNKKFCSDKCRFNHWAKFHPRVNLTNG